MPKLIPLAAAAPNETPCVAGAAAVGVPKLGGAVTGVVFGAPKPNPVGVPVLKKR